MVAVVIPESAEKYVALQCNSVLADYTDCTEFSLIWDKIVQLPHKLNILELGAGIGRISVYLHLTLQKDAHYYLVDGDSGEKQIAGMNYSSGPNYYNSWSAARDFCLANDIPAERLHLVPPDDLSSIPQDSIDLCLSAKAFGFHWPINACLEAVYAKMKSNGLLAFEMRSTLFARYNTEVRQNRAKNFNRYQSDKIDHKKYSILYNRLDVVNPVLLLQKVTV